MRNYANCAKKVSNTPMQHTYIALVALRNPMSVDEIAARLGLQDVKHYTTDLSAPKLVGRVGDRLWIIHLSQGTWKRAVEIRVYAVYGMSSNEASTTEERIESLLNE